MAPNMMRLCAIAAGVAAGLAAGITGFGVSARAQTGPDGPAAQAVADPVVARVNGAVILRSEVAAARQALPEQLRSAPLKSVFPAILSQIIDMMVVADAARADGMMNTPALKRRIRRYETQILQQAYLERAVAAEITEDALRARYAAFVKSAGGEIKVRARHILLKTEKQALAVIREIAGGADFAGLARRRSTGPSSTKGGDLGFFSRGQMVRPFADAAFAMKPGSVSLKPVKTRFGWHVIQVVERRAASVPQYQEVRDKLSNEMARKVIASAVAKLRAGARIEEFNMDGSLKSPAGAAPPPRRIRRVP